MANRLDKYRIPTQAASPASTNPITPMPSDISPPPGGRLTRFREPAPTAAPRMSETPAVKEAANPGLMEKAWKIGERIFGKEAMNSEVLGDLMNAVPPIAGAGLAVRYILKRALARKAATVASKAAAPAVVKAVPGAAQGAVKMAVKGTQEALPGIIPEPAVAKRIAGTAATRGTQEALPGIITKEKVPLKQAVIAGIKDVPKKVSAELRTAMTMLDASAPLRQGLVLGARYPKLFVKNFTHMHRMMFNDKVYKSTMDEITMRPNFRNGLMQKYLKDGLTGLAETGHMLAKEEAMAGTWIKKVRWVGAAARASDRAYTGFLTKLRADAFDHMVSSAQRAGVAMDDNLLKSMGRFINSATGRGDLGSWTSATEVLSTAMFSPRLIASRVNMLNPKYYRSLHPHVRKEALQSMIHTTAALSTVLGLSAAGGAKVGMDPLSTDFGQIVLGNKRIDLTGGFSGYLVAFTRLLYGESHDVQGQRVERKATGEPVTRRSIATDFAANKVAPMVSAIWELGAGVTREGRQIRALGRPLQPGSRGRKGSQPTDLPELAYDQFMNMMVSDMIDLYKEGGLPDMMLAPIAFYGGRVAVYRQRKN